MSQVKQGTLTSGVAVELLVSLGFPREKAQQMVDETLAAPVAPVTASPVQ